MKDLPQRPSQHILDNKASKKLESALPDEWINENIKNDYGIDYSVGIVNQGNVLGPNFSIQLKGKSDISQEKKATVQIKRSTLNYWNNRFEPTLVVIYCDKTKKLYYKWFDQSEFDLTSSQENFSFSIPKTNSFSDINWSHIQKEIIEIFALKHRLYHLYNISLSKLSNNEVSMIWSTYSKGKFEDTIEYCKQQLATEEDILWQSMLSHSYYETHQYKFALFHNQKAITLLKTETDEKVMRESSQDLMINRASILAEIGRNTGNKFYLLEALELWVKLIDDEKLENSKIYYNFANTCLQLRKLNLAEKYFQKSINLNKIDAKAWTNLADVYGLQGNYKEELKYYQVALKIDNSLKNARIGEAISFYHLKDFNTALEKLLELRKFEKEWQIGFSDYYFYLSDIYYQLGDKTQTMLVAEEGLFYDPGNLNLIHLLTHVYSNTWPKNAIIKEKAKKFFHKRIEVFDDDLVGVGELVMIKKSEDLSNKEIANFVKSYISFKESPTDEEIVKMFTRQSS